MIDERGERVSKIDYQLRKWEERGVLSCVKRWVLDAWGQNYKKATIIKCLEDKHLLDVDLSCSEKSILADRLIDGMPKINGEDALRVLSGMMIESLFNSDAVMMNRWFDIGKEKLKEHFNFNVEDKKNEGVQININTGAAIPDLGIQDLTSTINTDDGASLSNIDKVDPLDDLKDDPAYKQLLKDREVENDG